MNKYNEHVALFSHFVDKNKRYFTAYETGSPPTWKVVKHVMSVQFLKNLGFKPYRYKKMIADAEVLPPQEMKGSRF